jgi:hypothetical protein
MPFFLLFKIFRIVQVIHNIQFSLGLPVDWILHCDGTQALLHHGSSRRVESQPQPTSCFFVQAYEVRSIIYFIIYRTHKDFPDEVNF